MAQIPTNAVTGVAYAGANVPRLLSAAEERGWTDLRFLTYLQAKSVGAQVRKGEHGTRIVKVVDHKADDRKQDDHDYRAPRTYTVFNVAQVDGLPSDPQAVAAA
jgi:antirestriction protein ArdC